MNGGRRTVLITGTSTGFGRSATEMLAAAGWNVVATMRRPCEDVFAGLPDVLVTRLDVTDPGSVRQAIEAGIARFGRIDAVVNNAGDLVMGVFEAISDARARALFETNTFGLFNVVREILPYFRAQGHGAIVNVSSAVALSPIPMFSIYAATKYAIEGYSESLAYELAPLNIRVKLVEPGAAMTGITSRVMAEAAALPRIADYDAFIRHIQELSAKTAARGMAGPEQIAPVIVQALEDESPRLRYLAAEDFEELLRNRKAMGDESFLAGLRQLYRPA